MSRESTRTSPAEPPVDAIVLAAGRRKSTEARDPSRGMNAETLVECAVRTLQEGGCRRIAVVVDDTDSETARLAEQSGARAIPNDDPGAEPLDLIRLALALIPDDTAWAAILPVDRAFATPGTITRLIREAHTRRAAVIRPTNQGRPGHPTLFARQTFPAFDSADRGAGIDAVIDAFRDELVELEVDGPEARQ